VDTVDTLVQQLYGGQLDPQIGGVYFRHPRAQTATLAITAAFLAKGNKLWEVGFARYREFLYQLFPGAQSNWFAIQRSNSPHVLTFNYDQAFEAAFLERFNIQNYSLYDVRVLNSELISKATEIHAIGYSFSGIDRGPILEMLGRARNCQHFIVQSPDAEEICNRLKLDKPGLRNLIESIPLTF
jgi:hypothetical protein